MASEKGRKAWVSDEQRKQLGEIAWRKRTTASELVRLLLNSAATGSGEYRGEDSEPSTEKQLTFRMPETEWVAAKKAIQGNGSSVAETIRRGINAMARKELK